MNRYHVVCGGADSRGDISTATVDTRAVSREQALYRAFDELTDRSIRFVRVYSIDMWDEEAHAWVATNDHARAGRSGRPPEGH